MVEEFKINENVKFMWAGEEKTGTIIAIASFATKYFVHFEHKPKKYIKRWMHGSVLTRYDINGEIS
jgi:hypothetical protein